VPQARDQRGEVLQLEEPFRRLEVSEARRLKALESEKAKLKNLLAEAHLDNAALKDLLTKKW
jgi:putative transposase